jgi:hypothetical protein
MPSEHKIARKAANLWSKDGEHGTDWAAKTTKEMQEKGLPSKDRIAVLNRVIASAWDELNPDDQRPWMERAFKELTAELPLA